MKATILVDDAAPFGSVLSAEHGFSAYLEADGRRVLFDTGYSDAFVANAARLGIDLLDLDLIVLSHGHNDHAGGLVFFMRLLYAAIAEETAHRVPRLVCHPRCFWPRPRDPFPDIGPLLGEEAVRRFLPVELATGPVRLTRDLFYLGEIERRFPFEAFDPGTRRIVTPAGAEEPDLLLDETALAYRSEDGLVVITGCAHAGICSTVEQARRVCGEDRVADILGGLHLREPGPQLEGTCDYLRGLGPSALHACHCTSFAARAALAEILPLGEVGAGLRLEYAGRGSGSRTG
jgi:7,8-dihydropterin-6-yl-methyl-4-(beta-D-ribofuranosyl)aminobenzene 5'-phosphate synthase